jgi:hypothetical protein
MTRDLGIFALLWIPMVIFVVEFGGRLLQIFGGTRPADAAGIDFATLSAGTVVSLIAAFYGVSLANRGNGLSAPRAIATRLGQRLTAGADSSGIQSLATLAYSLLYVAIAIGAYLAFYLHADLTPDIVRNVPVTALGLVIAVAGAWGATR